MSAHYHIVRITPMPELATEAADSLDGFYDSVQDISEINELKTFTARDLGPDEWPVEAEHLRKLLSEHVARSEDGTVTVMRTTYYDG